MTFERNLKFILLFRTFSLCVGDPVRSCFLVSFVFIRVAAEKRVTVWTLTFLLNATELCINSYYHVIMIMCIMSVILLRLT